MTGLTRGRLLLSSLVLVGLVALGWAGLRYGLDPAIDPSATSLPPAEAQPLRPGQRVTFLELGSEGCKPCEAMKAVMEAVRGRFPEHLDVVFHDVRKNPSVAGDYRIRLIPTQVFLRPDGSEFFRHEGYFPLGEVEKVLGRMGVTR